jgi:hypothetical protein
LNPDKNQDVLEKQLKTLGQKIRIDILKKLSLSNNPLPYSSLQKEVLGTNPNAINFSFHLKALKNSVLIESSDNGYILSTMGKQILKNIVSIEQILNEKNKPIMIRTSKYSKEPFDTNKIEEFLIKEGQVEKFLAKQIAKEVEERLSKTTIEYLTTPLMREYINAILLEMGQEEIRHRLTRLGTPPFEVFKFFDDNSITSEKLLLKLGSDVSEQFLLLNLLPKNLADMYLSGEVILLNLNYWSLRPLGLYINTDSILDYILKNNRIDFNSHTSLINQINLIIKFFDTLTIFKPFFSEDLVLGDFANSFLLKYESEKQSSHLLNIIGSQILNQSSRVFDEKSHLSLDLSLLSETNETLDNLFNPIKNLSQNIRPLLLIDTSSLQSSEGSLESLINYLKCGYCSNFIFFNNNESKLLNSSLINVRNSNANYPKRNRIILDKILINLHDIAANSCQNDNTFFDYLQEKLNSLFEFFDYKKELVNQRFKSSEQWREIASEFFEVKEGKWIEESLKSVSFIGFNEAVKTHCGIEIDRIDKSKSFAYEILKFMADIIEEKNQRENENYILTQPHYDGYLHDGHKYCTNIIRENSQLSIKSKIDLYTKFEKVLGGGSVFTLETNIQSVEKQLNSLIKTNLNAFQFKI